MIVLNTPYKLGTKTLWLSMLQFGLPAMMLFIILLVLVFVVLVGSAALFGTFHLTISQYILIDNMTSLGIFLVITLFVITAVYAILFSWFSYINYTFTLGDHALEINQGILSRSEMSIPYRQIQDVDISQSLIQRLLGVCRFVVLTAGQEDHDSVHSNREHSEGVFILIDRQLASDLQEELIKRSNVQEIREFKDADISLQKLSNGPSEPHI